MAAPCRRRATGGSRTSSPRWSRSCAAAASGSCWPPSGPARCRSTSWCRSSTTAQFAALQRPYNQVMGVAAAHLHRLVRGAAPPRRRRPRARPPGGVRADRARARSATTPRRCCTPCTGTSQAPRAVRRFDGGARVWVNGVSFAQLATAPPALRARSVGHVHLATPLAVDADRRPAVPKARAPRRPRAGHPGQGPARRRAARAPDRARPRARRARSGRTTAPSSCADRRSRPTPTSATGARGRAAGRRRRVRWVGTVRGGERDELVARAAAPLFPLLLGGARRHRRRRVARAGHAGRRVPPRMPARARRPRADRAARRTWRRRTRLAAAVVGGRRSSTRGSAAARPPAASRRRGWPTRYLRLYERVLERSAADALRSHTAADGLVEQQYGSEVSARALSS